MMNNTNTNTTYNMPSALQQVWYFTNHRKQAITDMLKVGSIFGMPILACAGLTAFVVMTRGFGSLALTCLTLTMIIVMMVFSFTLKTWRSLKGFRMEENYIGTDQHGLVICERGQVRHFAWDSIRTVHEFYALGYGCNLKLVLKNIGSDGFYENYMFNVDGIPNSAHIYGPDAMMSRIVAAWQTACPQQA